MNLQFCAEYGFFLGDVYRYSDFASVDTQTQKDVLYATTPVLTYFALYVSIQPKRMFARILVLFS